MLYRIRNGDICIPEYMNRRYLVNEEARYCYKQLPEDTLRLFRTAREWIGDVVPPDGHITELGCGSGQFAGMLFDCGHKNYIGYDFSEAAIKRAIELNPAYAECFVNADVRNLQLDEAGVVVCFEVFEHIIDDLALIKALPHGAVFIFSVPNFDSFTHVRKLNDLAAVVERYGAYMEFDRYQKINTSYKGFCWFLVQGSIR